MPTLCLISVAPALVIAVGSLSAYELAAAGLALFTIYVITAEPF